MPSLSGKRIRYDRNFLMQCRSSPLAKRLPPNLPDVPGVTSPAKVGMRHLGVNKVRRLEEVYAH